MTKTALQQLIERLWTTTRIHKIETGVSRSYVDIEDVILLIKESLPTEKEQMEDAWDDGENEGYVAGYYDCENSCKTDRTSLFNLYHTKTYQDEK